MKTAIATHFLEFVHPFRISSVSRTGTNSVFVRIEHNGRTGFGEATLPPYIRENAQIVAEQINKFSKAAKELSPDHQDIFQILPDATDFPAARCAVEEALLSCRTALPPITNTAPLSTYTIGIGTEEEDAEKISRSDGFRILKVKLGSRDDAERIKRIRKLTEKPLCADLNQGYNSREEAKKIAWILGDLGVLFMEQPFAREDYDSHKWLRENSPVPVIADESIQNMDDLVKYGTFFDGVNVKLIKAGGPLAAAAMLKKAGDMGLYRVIGCMSESGCGIWHAAGIQHLADLADLDGPWLIKNDPFRVIELKEGKIVRNKLALTGELDFTEL